MLCEHVERRKGKRGGGTSLRIIGTGVGGRGVRRGLDTFAPGAGGAPPGPEARPCSPWRTNPRKFLVGHGIVNCVCTPQASFRSPKATIKVNILCYKFIND